MTALTTKQSRVRQYSVANSGTPKGENDTNPWRYCGEYFDKETNTYYLRARYYNPTTGRFLAADKHWNSKNAIYGDSPLQLNGYTYAPQMIAIMQSSNLYVYGINSPLRWIDPSGKAVTEWDIAVMGGIPGRIERMQWITDNWSSGTAKQQAEWRAEVEGYRATWRNRAGTEYTDSNGITRETATGGEIKFYHSELKLGTALVIFNIGYSLNGNNRVSLTPERQRVHIVDRGIGIDYHLDTQHFTTNGFSISYILEYSMTTVVGSWLFWESSFKTEGGENNRQYYDRDR